MERPRVKPNEVLKTAAKAATRIAPTLIAAELLIGCTSVQPTGHTSVQENFPGVKVLFEEFRRQETFQERSFTSLKVQGVDDDATVDLINNDGLSIQTNFYEADNFDYSEAIGRAPEGTTIDQAIIFSVEGKKSCFSM